MKKNLVLVALLAICCVSCKKERNRQLLNAYFKFTVNGAERNIKDEALDANLFDCTIKGDTALYIDVDKQGEAAGFIVKGYPLKDSTYTLDSINRGYYTPPSDARYYTNNNHKGTITIKRSTFEAASMLNTLEGTFQYEAEDTALHRVYTVTGGSFLMERQE